MEVGPLWMRITRLEDVAPAALTGSLIDPAPKPQTRALRDEERSTIEWGLERLEPRQAQAIRLRYLGGGTFPEVGEALGCSAEAARKLWLRALVSLQVLPENADDSGLPR